ncbi:MAG TPA: hypothetical protein VK668_20340 [Mucilaginibacter sp.]|nr:hypothetical protein [Mucilaginibacter sp.]
MKKAWWWVISIYSVFLLILGILIGKTIQRWAIIKVKTEVDTVGAIISLLSLAVTLAVAYWVASILESKKEANRVEKDLIIKRIDDIYGLIEETSIKVAVQEIDLILAVSKIKRISVNIISVIETVKQAKITIDEAHQSKIIDAIGDLKILLTNTPLIGDEHLENLPLEIREGIIHMSSDRRLQIDSEFDKIKRLIFNLELSINKA